MYHQLKYVTRRSAIYQFEFRPGPVTEECYELFFANGVWRGKTRSACRIFNAVLLLLAPRPVASAKTSEFL